MNKMSLRVLWQDGTSKDVNLTASDIVATELKFDIAVDKMERASHLYYLAYSAEKRTKETAKEFEEWLTTVEGVQVNDPKD